MAQNQSPIFGLVPNIGVPKNLSAANVKSDGSGTVGTDLFLVFTAGANGSWLSKARATVAASAASTVTSATTIRFYLATVNTGTPTAGTNIWQLCEIALASVTADQNNAQLAPQEYPLNMAIPTGTYVLASTHTAPAASTQHQAMVVGTDY